MKIFGFDSEKSWDYENGFYITSNVSRVGKLLAHYELYKKIQNIPGDVVECGVFKGASLIRFATFRNLIEYPYSRKIIGFDAFGSFPKQDIHEEQVFAEEFEAKSGLGMSEEELYEVFKHKKIDNVELIKGDIDKTIPEYTDSHPAIKIALLHIDTDVYLSTKTILENFFSKVVKNGLIIFDDYGIIDGETKAVDEFFSNMDVEFKKFPFSRSPVYVEK